MRSGGCAGRRTWGGRRGDHQALALALAHRAVADAGGAAALALGGDAAAKDRVGVYFGAWQRGGGEGKASAYGALGEALGALPGRVAESLDARGPCLLVDTACSSALVALDAALGDLRRGRVDWALRARDRDALASSRPPPGFLRPALANFLPPP